MKQAGKQGIMALKLGYTGRGWRGQLVSTISPTQCCCVCLFFFGGGGEGRGVTSKFQFLFTTAFIFLFCTVYMNLEMARNANLKLSQNVFQ